MKIGIWHTFTNEEKKLIRADIDPSKKSGMATPSELCEWSHQTIQEKLDALKETANG